jgi:HD-GYP domain-containing protein (c-di-GMP phosphodiesterase class II)
VLLPGLNRRETEGRMSAVCETVVGHGYRPSGYALPIPVGISCGVAVWPEDSFSRNTSPGRGISDSAVSLLLRADERLYQNKTNSRDMWSSTLRDDWKDEIEGFDVLDSLVVAIHMRDRYTLRHSEDVMLYSILIAQELDLDLPQIETLKLAAFLHDIGMIGVPEALMRRPARLTASEFASIKLHPAMGAAIVSTVGELNEIMPVIRNHHERWDGGGYPAGKARGDIPLMSRIVAVADAFSAMTTDRPFRSGRSAPEAGEILRTGSNLQWDPDCVEAFLSAYFRGNPTFF